MTNHPSQATSQTKSLVKDSQPTLWNQLSPVQRHQLAQYLAQLIQRIRNQAHNPETSNERD